MNENKELRHRDAKLLGHGHIASKWQSQDLTSGLDGSKNPYCLCCSPEQQRWAQLEEEVRGRELDNIQLPKSELPLSPPTGQVTLHSW